MDQISIGKFIAELRKKKNLTQSDLAEKLGISDRAVSKWERGINLPDASLMLELSSILDITVNELLTGSIIKEKEYMNKAEENLVELKKELELSNKKLLNFEWIIGSSSSIAFISLIYIASYFNMNDIVRALLIGLGIILFIIGIVTAMYIEKNVGYYECMKCHHKYIPTNAQMWFSMHIVRDRYIKCPKCHERSWNKKVTTK